MKTIRQLNVFIASPGDVPNEREIARELCEEVSNDPLILSKNISLKPSGWEDVFPEAGRPQEIINRLVKECELFVCVLHKRFGAPTKKEESGTLEEFLLAYDSWKKTRKPHIMFYFKDAVIRKSKEAQDPQFMKVLELKEKIENNHLLLYKNFDKPESFRDLFRNNLKSWLAEYPFQDDSPSNSVPQKVAPLQIPDAYAQWLIEQCQHLDIDRLVDSRDTDFLHSIKMPQIFIPLFANPPWEKTDTREEHEKPDPVNIEELAAKNDYLAIKGQAGSGKTTLMKHLAYSIIKKEHAHGLNEYLPVFLVMNERKYSSNPFRLTKGPADLVW